jgi:hypothetical protein
VFPPLQELPILAAGVVADFGRKLAVQAALA